MFKFRRDVPFATVVGLTWALSASGAAAQSTGYSWSYGLGTAATTEELAAFGGLSAQPDGRGLPSGKGGYEQGKKVYAEACAACHGEKLEGIPKPGIGGDKLIGARGSLASEAPVKTIESFWPYASTLVDYIKRAMPFNAPGSLSNDDVYAVTAYILAEANIVPKTAVLDQDSVAKVEMPNRKGFVPDPRPEIELYR
jgi:S-disulfanyl-L-cysteine oxidoreductase SoxD